MPTVVLAPAVARWLLLVMLVLMCAEVIMAWWFGSARAPADATLLTRAAYLYRTCIAKTHRKVFRRSQHGFNQPGDSFLSNAKGGPCDAYRSHDAP